LHVRLFAALKKCRPVRSASPASLYATGQMKRAAAAAARDRGGGYLGVHNDID